MTKDKATNVKEAATSQADDIWKAFNDFLAERDEFKGIHVKSFRLASANNAGCVKVCKNVKDPTTGEFTVVCTLVCPPAG